MRTLRRGRRVTPATMWAAVCAALLVHGAVVGTVHGLGLSLVGEGFGHHERAKPTVETDLVASCKGDALLASSARISMCYAPWHADVDQCIDEAQTRMWMDLSSCQARDQSAIAAVSMLSPKQIDKLKSIDPEPLLEMPKDQPPPPKPPEVPKPQPAQPQQQVQAQPRPTPTRPQQVVETVKPSQEEAPDNARFLAEYNTRVDHQTVARGAVKEPMIAKSKPEELTAKQDPKEASVKERPEDRPRGTNEKAPDVPGTLSMRNPGAQSPAEVQQDMKTHGTVGGATGPVALDGYMARRGDGAIEQQHKDRSEIPKGQNGAGGGAPEVPNLKPSQDVLERALGGGSVDHLEEIDSGDETALSAKRWIYASFFNRLKRQVAQNWDPASVWRRNDPNGQVYGYKTRVTEVRVSLSAKGELAKIVVTGPSGVGELDDEAVRAFHASAPFPNPPPELAAKDGLIVFAFSFYFEIGTPHTSWRVVRTM
jgi:TonB family protein